MEEKLSLKGKIEKHRNNYTGLIIYQVFLLAHNHHVSHHVTEYSTARTEEYLTIIH